MTAKNEVASSVVAPSEVSESIQAGYDRIANPEKVQEELPAKTKPTVETPPEREFTNEQIKDALTQVARIPELEKRLRDDGGRYGALKQTLEQLQQRMSAGGSGAPVDVEEMLAGIKDDFGDDSSVYLSLKNAFSKITTSQAALDPSVIENIVAEKVEAAKKAEIQEAMDLLTEAHPTWMEDRKTPEFQEWRNSLSERERSKFNRSKDPDYVASKLDDFVEWKKAKAVAPPPPPPKREQQPSKRLLSAVMPTNGTKPKTSGESDPKASIRAGYERVAGARMR